MLDKVLAMFKQDYSSCYYLQNSFSYAAPTVFPVPVLSQFLRYARNYVAIRL
jgi:hypothetical protein